MAPEKPRLAGLDIVRLVGVVAIVVGHVIGVPSKPWLYTWHVPVFFVLSGFLWRDQRSLGVELRRRWWSLGAPYLAWMAVNLLVWEVVALAKGGVITGAQWRKVALGGWYLGYPPNAFWFVGALFVAAIVMRLAFKAGWWLAGLVGLAGFVWATGWPDAVRHVPWSAGVALAGVGFMFFGWVLAKLLPKVTRPVLVGAVIGLVGLLTGGVGWVPYLDMKRSDLSTPVVGVLVATLTCWGMVLVAGGLQRRFSARFANFVTWLAQLGLPVVLVHGLVLWCLRQTGLPTANWPVCLAVLVSSFAIAAAVKQLNPKVRRFFM